MRAFMTHGIGRNAAALALAWGLCAGAPARADEVYLHDGRVIEGKASEVDGRIRVSGSLGAVFYEKSQVMKIVYGKTPRDRYDELEAAAGDDAEAHFAVGQWCQRHGLPGEMRKEFEHTLARDPNHAGAHAGLGHVFHEGLWMTEEECNESRGFVRVGGKWRSPEELAAIQALAEQKELEAKTRKQVELLLDMLAAAKPENEAEAVKALEAIPLDLRLGVLREAMTNRDAKVRRYAAGTLGRDPQKQDLDRFLRMALRDGDVQCSAVASEVLSRAGHLERQRSVFVSALGDRQPLVVMRAAAALEAAGDKTCTAALVAALEWTYEVNSAAGGGGTIEGGVTRGSERTSGRFLDREHVQEVEDTRFRIPVGGGISPETMDQVRRAILSALKKITGHSFGSNLALWRWYVNELKTAETIRPQGQDK